MFCNEYKRHAALTLLTQAGGITSITIHLWSKSSAKLPTTTTDGAIQKQPTRHSKHGSVRHRRKGKPVDGDHVRLGSSKKEMTAVKAKGRQNIATTKPSLPRTRKTGKTGDFHIPEDLRDQRKYNLRPRGTIWHRSENTAGFRLEGEERGIEETLVWRWPPKECCCLQCCCIC